MCSFVCARPFRWSFPSYSKRSAIVANSRLFAARKSSYYLQPEFQETGFRGSPWLTCQSYIEPTSDRSSVESETFRSTTWNASQLLSGQNDPRRKRGSTASNLCASPESGGKILQRSSAEPLNKENLGRSLTQSGIADSVRRIPPTCRDHQIGACRRGPAWSSRLGRRISYRDSR